MEQLAKELRELVAESAKMALNISTLLWHIQRREIILANWADRQALRGVRPELPGNLGDFDAGMELDGFSPALREDVVAQPDESTWTNADRTPNIAPDFDDGLFGKPIAIQSVNQKQVDKFTRAADSLVEVKGFWAARLYFTFQSLTYAPKIFFYELGKFVMKVLGIKA